MLALVSFRSASALALLWLWLLPAVASDTIRGFTFPDEVAGFRRGILIDIESRAKGLGVIIPYSAPDMKVAVFIYDLGIPGLPAGIDAPVVVAQARQATKDIFDAYSDVRVLEKLAPGAGSCSNFLRAKFSYVDPHSRSTSLLHSYLYLGSKNGNFIRVRLNYPADLASLAVEGSELRFMQALCKLANR